MTLTRPEFENNNPYYDPEKCGLKLLFTLEDPSQCYDFSTVILVQDIESSKVYVCHDSGCSCPSPFENIHSLNDMTEVRSLKAVRDFVDSIGTRYSLKDVHALEDVADGVLIERS